MYKSTRKAYYYVPFQSECKYMQNLNRKRWNTTVRIDVPNKEEEEEDTMSLQ